jgi:hypothetical protein
MRRTPRAAREQAEGHDRSSLILPNKQDELIAAVTAEVRGADLAEVVADLAEVAADLAEAVLK